MTQAEFDAQQASKSVAVLKEHFTDDEIYSLAFLGMGVAAASKDLADKAFMVKAMKVSAAMIELEIEAKAFKPE